MAERKRVMILPDAHVPSADPDCIDIVVKAAEHLRPDQIVILGDWVDGDAASFHPPTSMQEDPQTLQSEYAGVHEIMDRLSNASRGCEFVCLSGNHCARVERQAIKLGGALGASFYNALSPKVAIADARSDTEWIEYAKNELSFYRITDDLIAVHGWSASKNAAAAHLAKAATVSVVHGHTHRASSMSTRDILTGRPIKAWSPGCLCKLQPFYAHKNGPTSWTHGFSVVYVGRSGDWTDTTHAIKPRTGGGKFCVLDGGKEIKS